MPRIDYAAGFGAAGFGAFDWAGCWLCRFPTAWLLIRWGP